MTHRHAHSCTRFPWGAVVAFNPVAKAQFHSTVQNRLRRLATLLGLARKDYDLRSNSGGVAVSGEVTLHTDTLYVQVAQPCMGNEFGILYRRCMGRKDYTGGCNYFAPLAWLDDLPRLVDKLRVLVLAGEVS